MKSAGKARNNGLYRHIRTSKEIIRNLLNDSANNKISTVEGNWGSPRCVRIFDDAAAEHNGYTIIGFARPVYA